MSLVMPEDKHPTTRRYSRTLAEAFPDERAVAIEHFPAPVPPLQRVLGVLLAIFIGVTLALLAVRELAGG